MNQIITIQTQPTRCCLHGWMVYTAGDGSKNPHYLRLYENACKKRGMSVAQCLYHPKMLGDKAAEGRLRELLLAQAPAFVINRTRDYRLAKWLADAGICVYNH